VRRIGLEALKLWVITLITACIICTLLEKLAPDGGLNKYVRLACGLILTVIIISPIIRFLGGNFKYEEMVWKDYMTLSEREMEKRIRNLEQEDSRQLLVLYRQSVTSDVKDRYKGYPFRIMEVDLVMREDYGSNDYGTIRTLYIKVGPGKEKKEFTEETAAKMKKELSELLSIDEEIIVIDHSLMN
jgi:stage III sporulation protein AF